MNTIIAHHPHWQPLADAVTLALAPKPATVKPPWRALDVCRRMVQEGASAKEALASVR